MILSDIRLPTDRDGFRFRGGAPAIDLPATLAARAKTPRDLLGTPADLERWLVASGLMPTRVDEAALQEAKALREAIYAVAIARLAGEAAPAALVELNRIAAGAPAVPQLDADGHVVWRGDAAAMLVTLARDALDLLARDTPVRLGQCASDTCTLLFLDSSRAGERRWCSMAGCGNKAKVAEFRKRRAAARADAASDVA